MLFFVVFILFSVLILRLGIVQIVYGDDFKREIERTEDITVNYPVPRGKMYDRNGKLIVGNQSENAITYTKYQKTTQKEMIEVAQKLADLIEMTPKAIEKLSVSDKKDYWFIKHPKKAKKKITEKEWKKYNEKKLDDKKIYKMQRERITEEDLATLTPADLEVCAIYREFNRGYALTPQLVKNEGVTPEEYARVGENLESLPGVDTTTDWKRFYPMGLTLTSVLGKITDSEKGLPSEKLDYYLSRDYNRNDRVGTSYIEMQYEDVLTGQKAKVRNKTDKAGDIVSSEVVSEGKSGKDLVLSIDMELQPVVEGIITEHLLANKKKANTNLLDRAYVILMDPNTGEILTMAGKRIVKDEFGKDVIQDDALGNITTSYNVGSAVKGATVLTGYQTGAIAPRTVLVDRPLNLGGNMFSSWSSSLHGPMNDVDALRRSSNVYMGLTAIAIGKGTYTGNGLRGVDIDYGFQTMRNSFAQFGLGVRTGIDLPSETLGFKGPLIYSEPGRLVYFSIGQLDTYSNMQLAQYVSTIANGGKRLEPHIVKSINEPVMEKDQLGPVSIEITPKILNRLPMKEEWISRVQEGFRQVMQAPQGTATSFFGSKEYKPAGKTGTAQAQYDGPKRKPGDPAMSTINLSLIGYAPHDNPEVAMAVLVPWAYQGDHGHYMNNQVGAAVMDAYFNLKNARQAQALAEAQPVISTPTTEETPAQ